MLKHFRVGRSFFISFFSSSSSSLQVIGKCSWCLPLIIIHVYNDNLYLKSLHISTTYISYIELLLRLFKNIMHTIYIELWKCDLLKAKPDDASDGDRTGDPSVQSPMRYRLRQPALLRHYAMGMIRYVYIRLLQM